MNDDIRSEIREEPVDQRRVRDRAFDLGQARLMREVVASARRKVIDGEHSVAPRQQHIRHCRADLAGTTRNERSHISFLNYTAFCCFSGQSPNQRLVRRRSVVEHLMPELKAEEAPYLA